MRARRVRADGGEGQPERPGRTYVSSSPTRAHEGTGGDIPSSGIGRARSGLTRSPCFPLPWRVRSKHLSKKRAWREVAPAAVEARGDAKTNILRGRAYRGVHHRSGSVLVAEARETSFRSYALRISWLITAAERSRDGQARRAERARQATSTAEWDEYRVVGSVIGRIVFTGLEDVDGTR